VAGRRFDRRTDLPVHYPDDSVGRVREHVAEGANRTPDPFLCDKDDGTVRPVDQGRLDDAPNPDDEPSERELAEAVEVLLAGGAVDDEFRASRDCSIEWRVGNEPDDRD
jgi:hypothetical protein